MLQVMSEKELIGYNKYHAYKQGYRNGVAASAYNEIALKRYPEYMMGYEKGRKDSNKAMMAYLKKHKLKPPSPLRGKSEGV